MTRGFSALLLGTVLLMPLAACGTATDAAAPAPAAITEDAVGHYCQMYLSDHAGPKGQIAERGAREPIWFAQVRDLVGYLRGRERGGDILAVYVSDMGKAPEWADPGRDNWIDANTAWYVIRSRRMGGMGAPEAVPFGTKAGADGFAKSNGGEVVRLAGIPDSYLGTPGSMEAMPAMGAAAPGDPADSAPVER